ncbi:MAG: M67 family metallopeptidase [Candidatus Sulfobium sp.]|jgi:[CysO sulfur-carrier protein]-S-L-cysteine hydrolase
MLIIPRVILDKIISHCRSVYPDEACGVLAGEKNVVQKIYEMTNAEPSPVSYFMDPKEQFSAMKEMRREGLHMVAIYHSHPGSPAYPSAKDVSLAFYADSLYMIVGLSYRDKPEVRVFRIVEGNVSETEIEVPD